MKDYLMNGPALDIPVYMTVDNGTGDPNNGRFILRRNQNNPTSNEFLLLFCYFGNQGGSHSTEIHFPYHTIANVRQITSFKTWYYGLQNGNHTLYFHPLSYSDYKKDVYARAFFVTLN